MNYQENNKINGVPEGILYGQNERVDEINNRIGSRYFSDIPLTPNFDPRPVSTKYSLFPLVNRRKESNEPIKRLPHHVVEVNFNPGSARAPPEGFINNVDVETTLRNQTVALQHGAYKGTYIPSSNSDLYNVSVPYKPSAQPHPDLFLKYELNTSVPGKLSQSNIGKNTFSNHTRTQLRGGL